MKRRELRLEEIPFFPTVLTYTMHHGNQFITPAHFMAAVVSNPSVRCLIMRAFNVDASKVFEISHGLYLYCEEMRLSYIKEGASVEMRPSMEMLDFLDNYSRDIYKQNNLTFGTFLQVTSKCSDAVSSIFESILDKTMDYVVKTILSVEGSSPTFKLSLNDYFEYLDYMKSTSPDEVYESLKNSDSEEPDRITTICKTAVEQFSSNVSFMHMCNLMKEAVELPYIAVSMSLKMQTPYAQIQNFVVPLLSLGYEELTTMLERVGHEDELDTMISQLIAIYNSMDDNTLSDINAVSSKVMATVKEDASEGLNIGTSPRTVKAAEEAKSENVYMYGNEKLIEVAKDTMVRLDNPNLIVLGDSGTGKTTFVNKIISMANNDEFKDIGLSVYPCKMDVGVMSSRAKYKGEFEATFRRFIGDMVKKAQNAKKKPLLIIEDINQTVPTGIVSGDVTDTYVLLMEAMQKHHFPIIGTCTYDEYRTTVAKKRRYNDRFTVVRLEEPNREGVMTILKEKVSSIEEAYKIKVSEDALNRVYDLSAQFIRDKKFPAKALTLFNQTCAYAYTHGMQEVTANTVEALMERDYSIPSARLNTNLSESIKNISDDVKAHVFGQEQAVDLLVKYWKIKQAGLTKENKPIASLLFVGPTGVGKTELAKQFAKSIGYKMIRFDMSEYKEGHTISRLLGSPAGYVGYEDGGLLVNAIKSNPSCVLLLDEIEKAHPNLYDILLQIMDNAEITGSQGEKVDFQNVVLIMTSNCGARDAEGANRLGFNVDNNADNSLKEEIMQAELQRQFTPEFRGRLSAVVNFNPLSEEMCMQITDLRLKELQDSVKKTKEYVTLEFSDNLKAEIVNKTLSEKAGGRSIEKYIDEKVKDKLLDVLLSVNAGKETTIAVDIKGNDVVTYIK